MLTPHLERAALLMKQNRYADAEREIKSALSFEPNDPDALTLLAECYIDQNKLDQAEQVVLDALKAKPDNDFALIQRARIFYHKDKNKEAEAAVREAIALNPYNADYFGLLSMILIDGKKFPEALEMAEYGLAINSENLFCLNQRSTALVKLGRKEEAFETIDKALERDPDNANTHANYGWGHLEKGDHRKALEHFREALKLEPTNEYAKAGLVEALKARYWFYRIFLRYNLWVNNLSGQAQWAFIIGIWLLFRVVRTVAKNNPQLQAYLMPLIVLYILFALSTWIMKPLSNLFLRLNVYGRFALSEAETRASNFVGITLAVALVSGIMYFVTNIPPFSILGIVAFLMMFPFSTMFTPVKEKHKKILMGYTAILGLLGIGSILLSVSDENAAYLLLTPFFLGVFAYQWVANFVTIRT